MKTVRPQYTPPKKVATEKVVVENEIITQEYSVGKDEDGVMYKERRVISKEPLIDDTTTPVQYLMDSVIADKDRIINKEPVTMGNYVRFEITLTKRQYELWQKKGGESWLKKKLVGQKSTKKR